ncbi:MAG: tol-pal system YbgF family protein, partial [Nitrospiria bacterium]
SVLIGQADLYYQLDAFEEAYRIYEKIPKEADTVRMMPKDLFQYGESAYWAKQYDRSREIFMTFFNLYPKAPLSPIALARVGETWYLEGNITESRYISNQIRSLNPETSGREINDLLAAIGDLRLIPDRKGDRTDEGRLALKVIKKQTMALLADPSLPKPFQRVIFEAAEQSARHGALVNALEIEGALLARLSSSPFEEEVRTAFRNTADKTVEQMSKENDAMRVVELYHRHPAAFKPKRRTGSILLKVAIAHAQTGLLTEAVKLLTPIAANKMNLLGEEALFHLGDALYQNGEYKSAEETVRHFLARYPKSNRLPLVLEIFAKAKDRQGKWDQAIQAFRSWLKRYPRHLDRRRISLLLADAYQRKGDIRHAVEIFAKIDSDFGKSHKGKNRHTELHLKLADAYFQLGKYRKAAAFYRLVLKDKAGGKKADWAQFQLAMSYDRLGRKDQGAQIFARLAEEAEDPLLKEFSSEKTRDHR